MKLSQAIELLTELHKKHGDIEVAFDIEPSEISPGNKFLRLDVQEDLGEVYAIFVTTP